jgi:5-methyltetrahydrofolate corrinoid/iron sulfur protein methyltransferase
MRIIGENIHILSPRVKEAVANRDRKFFQDLAVRQVEAGAWALDLNIGPQKKAGHEILPWLVEAVQEVVDVPLSLDTTNRSSTPLRPRPSDWRGYRWWPRSSTPD